MDTIPAGAPRGRRLSELRRAGAPAANAPPATANAAPPSIELGPFRALAVPTAFIVALTAMIALPSIHTNPRLAWSFAGCAALLLVWTAWLLVTSRLRDATFVLELVIRKQHWVQACAQSSVFIYWGWYFREVYASVPLIVAQIVFAYAFDILLAWSRRRTYTLGFGPFPIILSTNLFLWFKPDWFYLQFVMIAVGFAAKELVTWEKEGRRAHIFNPSSFPLAVFSLGLLVTGNTALTWGQEIANTFENPPFIRLWIFLIALPGQYFFGVTLMTMSAVLTVMLFNVVYFSIFGTYFFIDAYVPAAVFLGMHLLFTDPSTSPRTEIGRILFGVLYGLAVVTLFALLEHMGAPTFYDKLLAVPLMNVCIQRLDRLATVPAVRRFDPAVRLASLAPRKRHLVYIGVWALVFALMSDPGYWLRPRRWVPFWQQACAESRHNGCSTLARIVTRYCREGSGWACNELGVLGASGHATSIPAAAAFEQACRLGFAAGCDNNLKRSRGERVFAEPPPADVDFPILLQEGSGRPADATPQDLHARACKQGWKEACGKPDSAK